jgi:hypothetical protein
MLSKIHFLIGACMPLVDVNVLAGTMLSQSPINANNPSKLLMAVVALAYALKLLKRPRLTVSSESVLFVLGAYIIYFIGNTIDILSFAAGASERAPTIASFVVTPLLLYVIPYLAVKSMLTDGRHVEGYIKGVAFSLFVLTVITLMQLNHFFGVVPPVTSLYGDYLFKLVESRWGGWGGALDIAPDFPLIGMQMRPAASFPEPSVFASYIFLTAAPLFIALRREPTVFMSRRSVEICAFLVLLLLGLSLSTTALVGVASLAIYKVLGRLKFSARSMVVAFAVLLVVISLGTPLFSQQIGNLVVGSTSLETRFGGFVAAVEQVLGNPWGTGFRFSSESLGHYIPQWAQNLQFQEQQDNNWFVSTFFGMQIVGMIGIVPFCVLLWTAHREMSRVEPCAPAFSRKLLHAYVWTLLISSFAAVQYQEPWFVYGIAIAYLFPRAGVGLTKGRVIIEKQQRRSGGSA